MGYKPKSDSYLMKMTKAEIISELRIAEHNFEVTEEALNVSANAGMKIADKFEKSKELLKAAVKDIGDMSRYCLGINCDHCPHIHTLSRGYQSCIWQHEEEALKLIGEDGEEE